MRAFHYLTAAAITLLFGAAAGCQPVVALSASTPASPEATTRVEIVDAGPLEFPDLLHFIEFDVRGPGRDVIALCSFPLNISSMGGDHVQHSAVELGDLTASEVRRVWCRHGSPAGLTGPPSVRIVDREEMESLGITEGDSDVEGHRPPAPRVGYVARLDR